MITIAKLGVGTAQNYYRTDYTAAGNKYYTQGQSLQGIWQGRLSAEMGLRGAVTEEHFERLTNGQEPWTGVQLIAWRSTAPPEPAWVNDQAAWREHLESIFQRALDAGINPLDPGQPAGDPYAMTDALRWMMTTVGQTAPSLRRETSVWLQSHLGILEPQRGEKAVASTGQHIAAWDITLRPHKTISLPALVGRDERLVAVVRAANSHALSVLEDYMQARGGGWNPPSTTAKWIIATFEHDTARPVDGYAAPLLHHHNLVMNMTAPDADSKLRAVWSKEFYKAQTLAEAVYQSDIALGAQELGYQIRKGPTHATEIVGFTKDYVDAESPRHRLIHEKLADLGLTGSVEAGKLVAMESREKKLQLTPEQQKAIHQLHGEQFGGQAQAVVAEALERGPRAHKSLGVAEAVEFARQRLSERRAVFEHYELLRDALTRGHGSLSIEQVKAEVERRIETGDLVAVGHVRAHAPESRYTTPEFLAIERETIARMRAGQNAMEPILPGADLSNGFGFTDNPLRLRVLEGFLKTRDQLVGLNGAAGSAKTSSLRIIAEQAGAVGYTVQGLAPTGNAVAALSKQGVLAKTLQRHLVEQLGTRKQQREGVAGKPADRPERVLYLVDEASLVSARQMHGFLRTLRPEDRAILIGDDAPNTGQVGQHTSIEAGRPFWQLQAAGMKTAHLRKNYRQKTPELKEIVMGFRQGQTEQALAKLESMGGVHEISHRQERFRAIGEWFIECPHKALVVVPDNDSRRGINGAIRAALKETGELKTDDLAIAVLAPRDILAADRTRAGNYRPGDTLRYIKSSPSLGVEAKSYATVTKVDEGRNQLTVTTDDGRDLTYDPSRAGSAVQLFEQRTQAFAVGEHVQFTASDKNLNVTNRSTGVIRSLEANGTARIVLDESGRGVNLNLNEKRHLDYAYTSTSHSAQARTVDRCAVQVDTDDHRTHGLVHQVFTYVACSRPEHEVAVFTDNKEHLGRCLGREHHVYTALSLEQAQELRREPGHETGRGLAELAG